MNPYVSGAVIKQLREKKKLTQSQLADLLCVSDKTISKWETARGLPDITLLEPLANALGISITELFVGECVTNQNKSSNMLRCSLYVCPVCGNVIHTTGDTVISCCGITLPSLKAEPEDAEHPIQTEQIGTELYVKIPNHPMTKQHYISFFAYVTTNCFEMVKLYPESEAEGYFVLHGHGKHGVLYAYCNHHGLFSKRI